jgi:hypothetical protein
MRSTTIFSECGQVLAVIDYHLTGDTVLRGPNNAVHAYYDADEDCTLDAFNRILARGNQIARLVPPLCVWAAIA